MQVTRVTNRLEPLAAGQRCRLRVLGADPPREVEIPPIGVVLGADPSVDVPLEDPAVSRRHCTIRPVAEGFEVVDLGSRNGTHLDGTALTRATVPPGATLRLGATFVQLMPEEVAAEVPESAATSFGALCGSSPAMRRLFGVLERASVSDAPILLLGESGTGKELAARAVHEHGKRRDGPFVVFDCGASSETLIESDLFGHRRGAFTGAVADRPGAFAQAAGGTLFLDELGDLPPALQPKLLRLLEAGEVTPLGAPRSERHDVRIVAATNRDLWAEVGRGTFRGDLYYRVAVVEAQLPSLRRRVSDIPELVRRFLSQLGAPADPLDPAALERLSAYAWPGNVRELRNVIARAVALSPPGTPLGRMPLLLRGAAAGEAESRVQAVRPFHELKDELVARFEREYLEDLLRRADGNLAEAARRAGLERKFLYKLLERSGLSRGRTT
ncbi:MAG: sigma 54-dependent Fis family transcriptional regulator [Deltaproteobacteria bacterium]|nr:sigma 54-dependent Fis family transcriptional regulator [Deltaproteobacteria bacterium]